MASYALVNPAGKIIQIEVATFPVSSPYAWTTDISTVTPAPQVGWVAAEANGIWTFTGPTPAPAPTLAQVQTTQSTAMQAACQAAIVRGFTSSALGSAYNYPSDPVTQTNITLAAVSGGSIWCQPSGGDWSYKAHTTAQAQAVQASLADWIQAQQTTYAGLLTDINTATTVAAVQAIAWP